ncbi:hypothetical protein THIOKS11350032 [Thiocapsa sp. KS1]|nr:hypothetical protein THIOKS11350032 [Thiocapsa sp. KS1]
MESHTGRPMSFLYAVQSGPMRQVLQPGPGLCARSGDR